MYDWVEDGASYNYAFEGLVSLTNPENTWSGINVAPEWGPQVIPVPKGTKVTLIAGKQGIAWRKVLKV